MKYFILLLTLCTYTLSAQTVSWDKPGTSNKTVTKKSPAYERAYNDLQIGNATYYADYLAGRPTAYGETYRPDQLTASHAHLPIGTILTVRRLDTGSSVKVRVNDNNGHSDGSLVVLSKQAAMELGMIEAGRTRVSVKRTGFDNWNPQPTQPAQRQMTARSATPTAQPQSYNSRPATYGSSVPSPRPAQQTTAYRTVRPASSYQAPQGSNVPDFSDGQVEQDPTAYQPATYQNQPAVTQTSTVYGRYTTNTTTAKSPSVVAREVPVSNQPYQAAQPATYSRNLPASVAPVNEVQVSSNQIQEGYAIQLAAYGNLENAQRQVRSLQNQGVDNIYVATVNRADGMTLNRVMVGPFSEAASAQRKADELLKKKQIQGIVTRLP